MPNYIEGKLDAKGLSFGIVVGRFNSFIAERLLEGVKFVPLLPGVA